MARKRRGRGEGSIFQRPDGLWVAEVNLGTDGHGKRRRKTVYGSTKKEVQDKLLAMQQRDAAGTLEVSSMSVRNCLDFWLGMIKTQVGASTYDRYKLDVDQHLTPRLGRLQLGHLTHVHVAQLFRDMAEAGSTPDAQRKAGTVLRQVLKHAVSLGLIHGNPALKVPLPRVTREEIHPLAPAEVARLLAAAAGDRLFALFVLALDSGMRQGELFALEWSDVDLDRGEVSVSKSLSEVRGELKVKETKTRKGRRRIPLAPSTVAELRRHRGRMLAEGHGSALVFPAAAGTHLRKSNVQRRHHAPALRRAGLAGVRFHDLRHTCATLLLLNNVNVKVVSERLGHASIEITLNTYSHVLPTMQEQAAAVMEGVLGRALPGDPAIPA